jgi:hypothetical protein
MLDGGKWSVSHSDHFTPHEVNPPFQVKWRLGGHKGHLAVSGDQKISTDQDSNCNPSSPQPSHYTYYTTSPPTTIHRKHLLQKTELALLLPGISHLNFYPKGEFYGLGR